MDKRLFLAISLSLLVLLSWSAFVSKTYHLDNKHVTSQNTIPIVPQATQITPPSVKVQEPAPAP
jgi:hypothetical protein